MSKQDVFAKRGPVKTDLGFKRHAAQLTQGISGRAVEQQRDERRTQWRYAKTELSGDFISKIRGADFWDGQSTRSDHQRMALEIALAGGQPEAVRFANRIHPATQKDLHIRPETLLAKQRDDFIGGAIAEQLAKPFLVIRNLMALHQTDEIGRCVAGEGGLVKVRIFRNEVI